ncbi:MAG: FmdE family protein [Ardenticatenia bacterium]|nr:FmdE family protein [Ardenticatenia bacterium]
MSVTLLETLLERSAERHRHLCPRQVLGVRMGLLGGATLGLPVPQENKRLLVIVETDGCFTDGLAVATGCWVGRRTMRVIDFGKVAATFVDTQRGRAVRIVPHPESRQRAQRYAPGVEDRWMGYLVGYKHMPDEELFVVRLVQLRFSLEKLISRDRYRVLCEHCGEEIINEREVFVDGHLLCRGCAGEAYYTYADADKGAVEDSLPAAMFRV